MREFCDYLAAALPLSRSPLFATGTGALGLLGWRKKRPLFSDEEITTGRAGAAA